MTNKEAVKILKIALAEVEWEYPLDYAVAIQKAIEVLKKEISKEKNESKAKEIGKSSLCFNGGNGFTIQPSVPKMPEVEKSKEEANVKTGETEELDFYSVTCSKIVNGCETDYLSNEFFVLAHSKEEAKRKFDICIKKASYTLLGDNVTYRPVSPINKCVGIVKVDCYSGCDVLGL